MEVGGGSRSDSAVDLVIGRWIWVEGRKGGANVDGFKVIHNDIFPVEIRICLTHSEGGVFIILPDAAGMNED